MGYGSVKITVDLVDENKYKVIVEMDGLSEYTFCSSLDLVDDKVKQLTVSIQEQFRKVFLEGFDDV
tara:strand:- start:950 stop:1147 length:198 start_codon:yes stop_codon:yes gene_type:complete